jgi:hypothetical protein
MIDNIEHVKQWLERMAESIKNNEEPSAHYYSFFIEEPMLGMVLVSIIEGLDEQEMDNERSYYSACIFALDVCVAQIQSAFENGNKQAEKNMIQLMDALANLMNQKKHNLLFWLPILNAFYDVHAELTPVLRNAYLNLVDEEDDTENGHDEIAHINSIRELIHELSDLSDFDIAENFFAQSYAMPADFFSDLLFDLYSIEEGQDIGLLALLHPEFEVREVVIATLESLMPQITLSSISLSRLKSIMSWYPPSYQDQLGRWIKEQRKKEVIFHQSTPVDIVSIHASEVDGGGAQGIFIHIKRGRQHRLCGLLVKYGLGIKDAWITPELSNKEMKHYNHEVFDDSMMLRRVDLSYLEKITNHFLALTIERGGMPDLHLLEIQEEIGLHFIPERMDVDSFIHELSIQITPFTPDVLLDSFKRSKLWPKTKRFTESWYLESAQIDKLVNRCCSFIDGVKVCRIEEAIQDVFTYEFENMRPRWVFHFIWISIWLKVSARKNEKLWQDSFFIAFSIHSGQPLNEIPIMQEICHQTVLNSIETMQERRTHLSQE